MRDEDDGVLLELEATATRRVVEVVEAQPSTAASRESGSDGATAPVMLLNETTAFADDHFFANVPSQDVVATLLLAEKKRAPLKKNAL
jgi:hypothetical protein